MSETTDGSEPLGSVADEASKLFAAMQDWAAHNLGDASHIATGAPECTWCPICQVISVLRGDRPEVSEKIATAATAAVEALRALLEAATTRPTTQRPVQHISFGDSASE
ncbi:hypothetical protein SAMN05892883_3560 [Jatrophihabitans sp. GAS493]|uniref:hypothetical protein n=1 Tax=Jatrophihabitans sp. GAS493 TaxID=1907575 RepID=UPI000BB6B419|nr:hypothetical protein [Jatrophihabitans sp. GAS493]SOD74376.1 hypothetical protein SAMN05892883_3560 [Jatrophihabitans sp. GAS493]